MPAPTLSIQHALDDPRDYTFHPYSYDGRMRHAILKLKFNRVTALGPALSAMLYDAYRVMNGPDYDLVIPVPIHWRREFERGFNQAELLASRFSEASSGPLPLLRIRYTRPQVGLSGASRRENLIGAFRASNEVVGKSVLVVDDVTTTGSTFLECATALKSSGAKRVICLSLATGEDF